MEKSAPKLTSKPKIQKTEIFKLTLKNFAAVGFTPDLKYQPYPLNEKILLGFLILISSIICNDLMYIIREAKTFVEYTQSIYMFSLAAIITLVFVTILLNVSELFNFISGVESLINTSKQQTYSNLCKFQHRFTFMHRFFVILAYKYTESRSNYNKISPLIEKLSETVFFVMTKLTPAILYVPWTIYTFFIYFSTDLGADAFALPTLLW